jgi:hypothetical protein
MFSGLRPMIALWTNTAFPTAPTVKVWERLSDATRRLGFPSSDLLQAEVLSGRKGIRFARVGRRDLLLLAKEDIDQYAVELNEGHPE